MTRGPGRRSWALVALLALFTELASSHPQCLDFKPPFKPPRPLTFCVQYSNFGCCDAGRDAALLERYYRISEHFGQATYTACASHLQSLLCQVSGGRARARSPPPTVPPPLHPSISFSPQPLWMELALILLHRQDCLCPSRFVGRAHNLVYLPAEDLLQFHCQA